MSNDISIEVKRSIIDGECAMWRNTLYQAEVRHRVNARIGATAEAQKAVEDQIVQCERALDALAEELKVLVAPAPMQPNYSDPESVNLDFTRTGRGPGSG